MKTTVSARLRDFGLAIALAAMATAFPAAAANFLVNIDDQQAIDDHGSAQDFNLNDAVCDVDNNPSAPHPCTLLAALQQANFNANRDGIKFQNGLNLITLTVGLPSIAHPVDIEGNVSGDDPLTAVDADGNGLFAFEHAASLNGGSSIKNLKLMNAGGVGLSLDGTPYIVDKLWIGLNQAGTAAAGSGGNGIVVQNTVDATPLPLNDLQDLLTALGIDSFGELFTAFGSNPLALVGALNGLLGQDNLIAITNSVISGNDDAGIRIAGGSDGMGNDTLTAGVIVSGNHIGTNAAGTDAVPNGTGTSGDGSGVLIEQKAALNFVIGNVIAANEGDGVRITAGEVDFPNFVGGNFIGLPNPFDVPNPLSLGPDTWGNFESGVFVASRPSAGNATGTASVVAANFVGFNRCGTWSDPPLDPSPDDEDGGISITNGGGISSDKAIVVGNLVGVAEFPPGGAILDLGNLCTGINVSDGQNIIGGANILDANAVGANDGDGIRVRSSFTNGNVIKGNRIGRDYTDSLTFANAGYGIWLDDSGGNIVGFEDGDAPLFGPNIIASPGASGIRLNGSNAFGNLLRRNRIYGVPVNFIGIELDRDGFSDQDIPDPIDDDDNDVNPLNYSNWGQNAPAICTSGGAGACAGAVDPGYSGGNTNIQWSLFSFRNANFRIDFYAISDDDAQWLSEVEVTTDATTGLAVTGPCNASGLCTSSFASDNTSGMQIVMTATRIDENIADIPPLEPDPPGNPNDDGPINNTSEYSAPAVIPDQIVFSQSLYTVAEGGGDASITVSRIGSGAASITLSLADLTTQPADHGALSATTLSWAADETPDKIITLPIVQDAIDEPNQSLELSFVIDSSDNAVVGTPGTAQVTITDDELPPLLTILGVGAAEGGDLEFTVTRQGDSEFTVSVDYAATPEPGTEAADIDASSDALSGTVSIPPGSSTATILIHAVDDAIFEPAENVRVEMSNPVNAALNPIGGNFAIAAIAASDSAPVIDIDDATVTEGDVNSSIQFTLSKTGMSELPSSVDYVVTAGTATTPNDYEAGPDALSGTILFAAAQTTATITLTVVGDTLPETITEMFSVMLQNAVDASIGDGTGIGTITDNDPPPAAGSLQFAVAASAVAENGGTATISVTRTGGSTGAVSIDYASSNGSATAGSDYTAASGTLNWAAGDTTPQTFTVTITDDATDEPDETVNLTLSNPTGGASSGAPNTAVLTITDNDPPPAAGSLQFAVAASAVAENGGTATISVTRTGGSTGAVSIDYASSNGSATAGSDYTATSGTLNWAAGDTTPQTFTVTITDDATDEPDETVNLTLSNPTGGASSGAPNTAVLTITDNDPPPAAGSLQFAVAASAVAENGATATISVTRTGGSTGAVSIDYASSNGSAAAGSDYTAASGTLNWANGDTTPQTFTVTITDDATDEPDETVNLTLSNPTGGASSGAPNTAVLTITDNDPPPAAGSLQFAVAASAVAENGATATISVTRTGGSTGAVSIDYASSNGSAAAGSDYTAASGTLNWAAGDTTPQTFTVTITDDATDEPDETVNLTLSNPIGGASSGAPNTAVLTITDDDPPPAAGSLQFAVAASAVAENGATATISVTRTGGSTGAVSIDYASSNGSATAGSDYTATSGTLNWAAGDTTPQTFTVAITDDATDEPDETVNLTLSNPIGGASSGAPNTAVLTITDNDPPPAAGSLQFAVAASAVAENGATATISVTRTGGSTGAVSIDYASSNGSAAAGSDYTAASGTLNWAAGDTTPQTFTVTITDDATDEPDETVNLTLSNPIGGASSGAPNTAVLTITDDDPPPAAGSLQFAVAASAVAENGATATISVTRTGGSTGAVSIDYASSNGSATAGSDYTATSGTLNWAAGDTTPQTFTVAITDDATDEPDETVNLTLSNPTGGASSGAPNTAVLTITDNDPPPAAGSLQFAVAASAVAENGATATISVTRTGGSTGAVSIDYASSNGSATAGSDYTATSGTLNWAAGDTTPQTFTVAITDDATDEPDETVNLTLSNPIGGASSGAPNTAVLTITDDDAAPGNKTFSGPTAPGSGIETIVFTGGGDPCGFSAGTMLAATPLPLPAGGYVFPHGVFVSNITNCTVGATLNFTITYPQALPAASVFWKFGRTLADPSMHWYLFPAVIVGNNATFSITDGGLGDDDLLMNGSIIDPSGPAFLQAGDPSAAVAIPAIDAVGRWLLLAMMLTFAGFALRRRD